MNNLNEIANILTNPSWFTLFLNSTFAMILAVILGVLSVIVFFCMMATRYEFDSFFNTEALALGLIDLCLLTATITLIVCILPPVNDDISGVAKAKQTINQEYQVKCLTVDTNTSIFKEDKQVIKIKLQSLNENDKTSSDKYASQNTYTAYLAPFDDNWYLASVDLNGNFSKIDPTKTIEQLKETTTNNYQ